MSRHVDVMMQGRDRKCEMSQDDYAYYVSRKDFGGYERERERMGRSRSRGESAVDERGEYGWDIGEGWSGGRARSRSPRKIYHEGKRLIRGNVLDVELGRSHSCRRKSTPPAIQPIETYEPALPVRSPCSIDKCKYGCPTGHEGLNEYIPGQRSKILVSDDIDMICGSLDDSRMVRPLQGVLPVSRYMETSRHFHPGSSNRTADKRDRHGNYPSKERGLNIGAYNENCHSPFSRDASYPLCSKSQENLYASTSHAFWEGDHISSRRREVPIPQTISDDLCRYVSVSERSAFDASEGQPMQYSTLDHNNSAVSSPHHLKSPHKSTQRLNYHYPIVRNRENSDLGHLSDSEHRNARAGFSQIHLERALRIGESNGFLPDEQFGALCQHNQKDRYTTHIPLSNMNENEDSYISDCSVKDCHFSHHFSNERDVHSDPHSCLSIPESVLQCGRDKDYKDPCFITASHDDPGYMAAGTCTENYHNQEEKTNYRNSRSDLIYNVDESREDFSDSRYWNSSIHNKQDGDQYYYTCRTASSTEPKDNYIDSGIYYPHISSDMKQHGDHFDLPPLKKKHYDESFRYKNSEIGSISTKHGLIYDANATSECGTLEDRVDASRKRWVGDCPKVRGAPSGVIEKNAVLYKTYSEHNSGCRTSHGRSRASLSTYLPDRSEVLSEEMTIGADHTRRTASRSIFDRLGSPQGSIDRFPREHVQGHFSSQKHELKQIKNNRKSNHLALKGFPHSSRGTRSMQSSSSNTNTDEVHLKPAKDTDTLKDVHLPPPTSHNNDKDLKQFIQNTFLLISQKINENPATRMRYMGQGKAGTLFCIVCKRSNSKEFRVTRDLAAHSLMCQKAELRAQHLGLFKAICVTMGWNSEIDQQTEIWTPQILPDEKALAQKEDLICWPPVFIVHNFSLLRKSHTARKVLTPEELEAFFRSKGFISGRVKVCLGQSTNNHITVIKFLGTFTGFKDSEKLHNYFAEMKRGRLEFWKLANSKGAKCSQSQPCGTDLPSDNAELPDLYGYMGIAEDWGKLDTESKKRCTVKSKQEIINFSTEPILPDSC